VNNSNTVVGLDVHKKTIVAAVLPSQSETVTETVTIENCPEAVEKLINRLVAKGPAEFVYEAGPCGYETHRQITALGHKCVVIAPGLTPVRPGDRVKTDRRDAEKLARYHRAGELTEIHVPTREKEADRDLPRAREDVLEDRLRARHRLSKFLLRQGRVHRETKSWGVTHRVWLKAQRFEWTTLQQSFEANLRAVEEAEARLAILDQQMQDLAQKEPYRTPVKYLRCLKGIDTVSALTLLVEVQDFTRFKKARGFMSFTGLVGSENSSSDRIRRGGITKVGNAHIRRILVESAWCNRHRNVVRQELTNRRSGCPQQIVSIARKAQTRLHRKFWRMTSRSKLQQVAVVAVARELAGFVWSIAQHFPKEVAA
jgi:transposase